MKIWFPLHKRIVKLYDLYQEKYKTRSFIEETTCCFIKKQQFSIQITSNK